MSITKRLYETDSHLYEFSAAVFSCTPRDGRWAVELDATAFFPEGGGQPADRGFIGDTSVWDVQEQDGQIFHLTDAPLPPGTAVTGRVDRARRLDFMRQHSAEHILSGILHRMTGGDNVGFHLSEDTVTVDWSLPLSDDQLKTAEAAANDVVYANLPVETQVWPDGVPAGTAYRAKRVLDGDVRLVGIPGTDLCACCGTHVKRTGEVGTIKIRSAVKYKGGTRLFLLAGGRALADYDDLCRQNTAVSQLLSAKPAETADAVRRLYDEREALRAQLTGLREQLTQLKAAAYAAVPGPLLLWEEAVPAVDSPWQAPQLRRLALTLSQARPERCAVFAGNDAEGWQYAVGWTEGDLRPLAKALNAACQGRGGGAPALVQGSVTASRAEIQRFFDAL